MNAVAWAWLSSLATALLIIFSGIALRTYDSISLNIMRAGCIVLFLTPIYAITAQGAHLSHLFSGKSAIFAVAASIIGALSWISFYQAIKLAPTSGTSLATVTIINHTSVILVALAVPIQNAVSRLTGGSVEAAANLPVKGWIGILLVLVGTFLVLDRDAG